MPNKRTWTNLHSRARRWEHRAKECGDQTGYSAIRKAHWLYEHGCRTEKCYRELELAINLVASVWRATHRVHS